MENDSTEAVKWYHKAAEQNHKRVIKGSVLDIDT